MEFTVNDVVSHYPHIPTLGCTDFLVACGGASDGTETTPKTIVLSFKVFGDNFIICKIHR
jgi:hypothetical protein